MTDEHDEAVAQVVVAQEVKQALPQPPARASFYLAELEHAPKTWTRHPFPPAGEEGHVSGWAAWFLVDGQEIPIGWEDETGLIVWKNPRVQRLHSPISMGTGSPALTEIRYQAIKGKHMRGMPMGGGQMLVGDFMDLAAALSTQPSRVFDQMAPEDVGEVIQRMRDFLDGGQQTGAESGPA